MTLFQIAHRHPIASQLALFLALAIINLANNQSVGAQLADNTSGPSPAPGPFLPVKILRGYVSLQHPKEPIKLEPLSPKLDEWRPRSLFQIFQEKPSRVSSFPEHSPPLMDRLIPEVDWNRFLTDTEEHRKRAAEAWEAASPQREAQARQFEGEFEERSRKMASNWEAGRAKRESATRKFLADSEKNLAQMIAQKERGESSAPNFFALSHRLDSLIAQALVMQQDVTSRTRTEVELMSSKTDEEIRTARRKWREEKSFNRKPQSSAPASEAETQSANTSQPTSVPVPSPDGTQAHPNTPALAQPPSQPATFPDAVVDPDERLSLLWDSWYENIDQLLHEPLIEELKRHGNPAGSNKVQVTVWSDHHLEAFTVTNGPTDFDEAVLDAYRSLNGNPALAFPSGSQRSIVTYFVEHKHVNSSAPDAVETHEIRGDREVIPKSR